jgi:putative transposase
MDTFPAEQALRQEAIRRCLAGETRIEICDALQRSPRWFDKWWAAYRRDPQTDFADHSRAPHRSPQQWPSDVVQMIVSIRRAREAGRTPETKYGFIGQRTIQADLERLGIKPPPSLAMIQRVLAAHELTHPLGAADDTAYYPSLTAWEPNAIHATDIITRHLRGGAEIQNFHTIDHFSQAVHLSQALDKASSTIRAHLLGNWGALGLPFIQQFDNEGAFCGGHTHPRVIGQVVRLCLFCGLEPLFIPEYEPKRNQLIETFHSVWLHGFWSRRRFRNLSHVQQEAPIFVRNYLRDYHPPTLDGRSPAQMRCGYKPFRLTAALRTVLSEGRLPITVGHIHVIRKVDCQGTVSLLNEAWSVGKKWMGEYVWSVIDTLDQTLTFWHQADAQSEWHHIKSRCFGLKESVQPLLPLFYRNRARCRERLPG